MSNARAVLVAAMALATAVSAQAQDAYLTLHARYAQPQPYGEAFALPGATGAAVFAVVRIPNSLIVFLNETDTDGASRFVSRLETSVQIRRGEALVHEVSRSADHAVANYDEATSREADFQTIIPLTVGPGRYAYRIVVRDLNGATSIPVAAGRLHVPAPGPLSVAAPVSVTFDSADTPMPAIANLSGDVPYAGAAGFVVPVYAEHGPLPTIRYSILRLPNEPTPRRRSTRRQDAALASWDDSETEDEVDLRAAHRLMSGTVTSEEAIAIDAGVLSASDPSRSMILARDTTHQRPLWGFPIRIAPDLPRDGSYAIEVEVDGGNTKLQRRFAFHWRNMPIALHDAETAIRLLSWIESTDTIRSLLRGSREERQQALADYWSARDPSPGTPYNELMAEYYRRIDYAASTFRTGGGAIPNGLRTDRARVYIVHGPPAQVERTLPMSGGVEETWTYEDGRRFVFHAASSVDPLILMNR